MSDEATETQSILRIEIQQEQNTKDIIEVKADQKELEDKSISTDNNITKIQGHMKGISTSVKSIEDDIKWLNRTFIGAIIGAVFTVIVGVVIYLATH